MASHRCSHCYQKIEDLGVSVFIMRELYGSVQPMSSMGLFNTLTNLRGIATTKNSVLQTCRNLADSGDIEKVHLGGNAYGWVPVYPTGESPLAQYGVGVPSSDAVEAARVQVQQEPWTKDSGEIIDLLVREMRAGVWAGEIRTGAALAAMAQQRLGCSIQSADFLVNFYAQKSGYYRIDVEDRATPDSAYSAWMAAGVRQAGIVQESTSISWTISQLARMLEQSGYGPVDANAIALHTKTHIGQEGS